MQDISQLDGLIDLLVEAVLREIREAKARPDGSPERAGVEKEVQHDNGND
jgi:hypothetical protein